MDVRVECFIFFIFFNILLSSFNGTSFTGYLKIKFNKVKGVSGYQILIYQRIKYTPGASHKTPIVYEKTTKKTAYTLKGLMPNFHHQFNLLSYFFSLLKLVFPIEYVTFSLKGGDGRGNNQKKKWKSCLWKVKIH